MLFFSALPLLASLFSASISGVVGLGSQCSAPLGSGSAAAGDPYWLENIAHQGTSAFGPAGYQVFRNVKDFGAKGDGVTDDTAAINAAISSGGRCGGGTCSASTTPATVYFPPGTYVVSTPIIAYYYTEMVGDAKNPPTLLATAGFVGIAVIDADPYIDGGNGAQWYVNQNNFYRSVRNFVIDLRQMPATSTATGFHWQVSQATSLYNIVVEMSTAAGTNHQGIFMENGSGGFMGGKKVPGRRYGIWVGNQQFTVRNITVNNANTGIFALWNWGWTFQGVTLTGCQVGFDISIGDTAGVSQGVGSETIIDAVVTDTPVFLRRATASNGVLDGSIVLNNIRLVNVPDAVVVNGGATLLAGGTTTIDSWAEGNTFTGSNGARTFTESTIPTVNKPASLLDSAGQIFGKTRPTYANFAVDEFVSVKAQGASGNGNTDDTAALQAVFDKFAGCKIIYFDAGTYLVSNTLRIPSGVQIYGEAWAAILGSGSVFSDDGNPEVVVQVGTSGSTGLAEVGGMLFTTRAPAGGAIMVEWNVHDPSGQQGAAGMWDTLFRIGGAAGTNIEGSQCFNTTSNIAACTGSFLGLHLTHTASAYLEGTWVWLADHDIETDAQINAFSGRGILSQSQGPVWLIGTAEHHVIYQYNLAGAANHYIGLAQTETPYFQPSIASPTPFSVDSSFSDPTPSGGFAWGLNVQDSSNILVFGSGFYSFFPSIQTYYQCRDTFSCQNQIVNVDSTSSVAFYGLSTVYCTFQLSVNGNGVINQNDNRDGLASTVTSWTQ
ncbi:exo-beta-1-3-glucanase [Amylostereum chailletii]|nr:exo-beta-1-3-glucanase [Amylostereum chailletii]